METNTDERLLYFAKAPQCCDCLCHLHEAQDALLHTRTTGGVQKEAGHAHLRTAFEQAGDPFARHRAHASAHEAKDVKAVTHGTAIELAPSDLDTLITAGLFTGEASSFGVLLAVKEAQRITRLDVLVPPLQMSVVEQEVSPLVGPHRVVVAAERADVPISLHLFSGHHRAAAAALLKQSAADRLLFAFVLLSGGFVGESQVRGGGCESEGGAEGSAVQNGAPVVPQNRTNPKD